MYDIFGIYHSKPGSIRLRALIKRDAETDPVSTSIEYRLKGILGRYQLPGMPVRAGVGCDFPEAGQSGVRVKSKTIPCDCEVFGRAPPESEVVVAHAYMSQNATYKGAMLMSGRCPSFRSPCASDNGTSPWIERWL